MRRKTRRSAEFALFLTACALTTAAIIMAIGLILR